MSDRFKMLSEMDQDLTENMVKLEGYFEELNELAVGDGPIDEKLAAIARLACGTCIVYFALREYEQEKLNDGFLEE